MADIGASKAPEDLVELGRIVSAYGVKGWVKVQPHSTQSAVLRAAPMWWLSPPSSPVLSSSTHSSRSSSTFASKQGQMALEVSAIDKNRPRKIFGHVVKQCRPQGLTVVADLEGIGDRDLAESMRGYTIHVSRQYFPQAQSGEFYWVDLVGCYVFADAQLVGVVDEVVDNGAHAILRVHRMQLAGEQIPTETHVPQVLLDPKGRPQEILVPFVAAHVQHVDILARRIETDWPLDL